VINWNLYETKLNRNGNNIRDRQINMMKNAVENDFEASPSYREAYFNDSQSITKIQVLEEDNPYVKTILMLPDESINVGDILNFDDEKWLCTKANKTNPVEQSGEVGLCNNTLTFYKSLISSTPIEIPCIVSTAGSSMGLDFDETKFINDVSDIIFVKVSNNETTQHIEINDVYKIGRNHYKVLADSDIVETGLLVFKMEKTVEQQVIPEIVEPTPTVGLSVEITGSTSIAKGTTKTYTAVFKQDDVVVSDTSEFWLTDDNNNPTTLAQIVSQDSMGNTCVVKGLNLGYVKLWIKNSAETVENSLRINIKNIF
jgi:hypothetical protein